jgi:hypothetical protein
LKLFGSVLWQGIAKAFLSGKTEMRPEEKARPATPAEQRRRRRKNILVFELLLLGVLGTLAITVLSVNNGRNYKRLVRQYGLQDYLLPAPAAPKLRIDKQRHLPPSTVYPPWLLNSHVERNDGFERGYFGDEEERCHNLQTRQIAEVSFKPNGPDWECLAFAEFGSAAERASLFVQARGTEPDLLRSFRMKLSLTDPDQSSALQKAALEAMDRFGLALSPESRSYISSKLSARIAFTSLLENYKATLSPEFTDERRFNLLLLPRPQTADCAAVEGLHGRVRAQVYPQQVACLDLHSSARAPNPDATRDPA